MDEQLQQLIDLLKKILAELQVVTCGPDLTMTFEGKASLTLPQTTPINAAQTSQLQVEAAVDARKQLTAFGEGWCKDGPCTTGACGPKLSGLTCTLSTLGVAPDPVHQQTNYSIQAKLTGKITCVCPAAK